jgi:hypothetical protein
LTTNFIAKLKQRFNNQNEKKRRNVKLFFSPKRLTPHFCQPPDINDLQTYEQANLTQRQKSEPSFIAAAGDTTAKHRERYLSPPPT